MVLLNLRISRRSIDESYSTLGTPTVCASPFLTVDEPGSIRAKYWTRPYYNRRVGSRGYLHLIAYATTDRNHLLTDCAESVNWIRLLDRRGCSRVRELLIRHKVYYVPLEFKACPFLYKGMHCTQ